jgi:hypothetical protein
MEDTRPYPLTPAEWKEIMADQTVRESWGIEANNTTLAEFSSQVYAVPTKNSILIDPVEFARIYR